MSAQNPVQEKLEQLGQARKVARAAKDFNEADRIRDQISALGWEIVDLTDGFTFIAKSRVSITSKINQLKAISYQEAVITVSMIVDGFCEDAADSIRSIKEFSGSSVAIVILINGEQDLGSLVELQDDRTFLLQITAKAGWGECANALLKIAPSSKLIIMDPSTRFIGDPLTMVMAAFEGEKWHAVGWKGGLINIDDEWRTVSDKGPGEVDVLFSYFLAVDRAAALEAGGFNIRALYYRNADIEFSLRLKQAQGKLLQLDLPLKQERHHGYYDVDPQYRDTQSKKNYDRILERFRGKNEILSPRR